MIGAVVDEVLRKIESATDEGIKAADDYMDADTGLLICGECRTKKQKKYHSWARNALSAVFADVRRRNWKKNVRNIG